MNFMYRDNGLTAATRRSIQTRTKLEKLQELEVHRQVIEKELQEKREIARYYEQNFQSKFPSSVTIASNLLRGVAPLPPQTRFDRSL